MRHRSFLVFLVLLTTVPLSAQQELTVFDAAGFPPGVVNVVSGTGEIVGDARGIGVPTKLAPFRSDNGDYLCCTSEGDGQR